MNIEFLSTVAVIALDPPAGPTVASEARELGTHDDDPFDRSVRRFIETARRVNPHRCSSTHQMHCAPSRWRSPANAL